MVQPPVTSNRAAQPHCYFAYVVPFRQVMGILDERQAASQQQSLTIKIWGEMRNSYLNNMGTLASATGEEVQKSSPPFFRLNLCTLLANVKAMFFVF